MVSEEIKVKDVSQTTYTATDHILVNFELEHTSVCCSFFFHQGVHALKITINLSKRFVFYHSRQMSNSSFQK